MGLDESEKVLADYNEAFADIINGFLRTEEIEGGIYSAGYSDTACG